MKKNYVRRILNKQLVKLHSFIKKNNKREWNKLPQASGYFRLSDKILL